VIGFLGSVGERHRSGGSAVFAQLVGQPAASFADHRLGFGVSNDATIGLSILTRINDLRPGLCSSERPTKGPAPVPSIQPLSEQISELRSALVHVLADVDQLILTLDDPAQRQRLQQIRLNIETALNAAPSFCTCATRSLRICSLTGIPLDP
jgi:hypothetical protein